MKSSYSICFLLAVPWTTSDLFHFVECYHKPYTPCKPNCMKKSGIFGINKINAIGSSKHQSIRGKIQAYKTFKKFSYCRYVLLEFYCAQFICILLETLTALHNTIEAKTYVIMCSLGQKNKKYIHKRDLKTATFQNIITTEKLQWSYSRCVLVNSAWTPIHLYPLMDPNCISWILFKPKSTEWWVKFGINHT